jgi:DNA invertase Pin-like site-specific DNA recombinase
MNDEELDITKLKYVLYARKSTDDNSRQLRSIEDQIAECQELARRLNLNISEPVIETKSAKRPNQRPLFRQILNDIKKGVYDGILAWNPDRLARNMKEGGEVIDMIDEGYIKDLKFVTHHFTSDANGKMLLGMAFVLSKQYSDDLSQKVTRGVRRSFAEGKSPAPKHGYVRDEDGLYRPDTITYPLITKAWEMRAEGTSIEEIVKFLNDNGYRRIIKKSGRKVRMTKQILSDLFNDPFYYGVLMQAGGEVDLVELYNFQPAIDKSTYIKVQSLSYRKIKPNKHHKVAFYPLRAMVACSYCGRNMYVAPSTGHTGQRYLNYRCDTNGCTRQKKSIRAKVIFDFIYQFLDEGLNFTEADYNKYYKDLEKITEDKREQIRMKIHSKRSVLLSTKRELKDRALALTDLNNKLSDTAKKVTEDRLAELKDLEIDLSEELVKLEKQIRDPEEDKLTLQQFLNLSKNASVIVQSADVVVKDEICRLIFLNLTVDEEKVALYQLKEPFDTLLKTRQIVSSRGSGT